MLFVVHHVEKGAVCAVLVADTLEGAAEYISGDFMLMGYSRTLDLQPEYCRVTFKKGQPPVDDTFTMLIQPPIRVHM